MGCIDEKIILVTKFKLVFIFLDFLLIILYFVLNVLISIYFYYKNYIKWQNYPSD